MDESKIKEELKNDFRYGLEVCKGLENLRIGNKSDIRESQVEAHTALNKAESELNKYFFTVATILVPIVFSFATIKEIAKLLDQSSALLVKLSLLFLLASILAGFLHMVMEIKFLNKWLKNETIKLRKWSSISFWPGVPVPSKIKEYVEEYDSLKKNVDDISQEMESRSSIIPLFFQAALLLIGIIFLIVAAFSII